MRLFGKFELPWLMFAVLVVARVMACESFEPAVSIRRRPLQSIRTSECCGPAADGPNPVRESADTLDLRANRRERCEKLASERGRSPSQARSLIFGLNCLFLENHRIAVRTASAKCLCFLDPEFA